jgi:hypothetical protein
VNHDHLISTCLGNFQKSIQDVFDHIGTFPQGSTFNKFKWETFIYCGNQLDKTMKNRCQTPGVQAYQWNTKNTSPSGPPFENSDAYSHMLFCDLFFQHARLDDAIDVVKKTTNDFKYRYDLTKYANTGRHSHQHQLVGRFTDPPQE